MTELLHHVQPVAYQHNGNPLGLEVAHLGEAFLLESGVAHRQHLVHQQDLGVAVDGHGEAQAHVHAGGVALHRGVDEVPQLGEGHDLIEPFADLPHGNP